MPSETQDLPARPQVIPRCAHVAASNHYHMFGDDVGSENRLRISSKSQTRFALPQVPEDYRAVTAASENRMCSRWALACRDMKNATRVRLKIQVVGAGFTVPYFADSISGA